MGYCESEHAIHQMKGLKVLECEYYFLMNESHFLYDHIQSDIAEIYERIDPVFHRAGFYYDRVNKKCWYEDNKGNAYTSDNLIETFKYQMEVLNHRSLTQKEIDAIHTLMSYNNCPSELSTQLRMESNVRQLREIKLYKYKRKHRKLAQEP